MSRETSECCFTYLVPPTTELYDFILNGRISLRRYTDVHLLNSLPTLIEHGRKKFVVFSHCGRATGPTDATRFLGGPTLYFYDVDLNKETKRLKGGEALINFKSKVKDDKGEIREGIGRVFFLGNAEIMKQPMWSHGYKLDPVEDAGKYELSVEKEKSAIAISLFVNFGRPDIDLLNCDNEGKLIKPQSDDDK